MNWTMGPFYVSVACKDGVYSLGAEEAQANAQLLAAAPDMYAALENLLKVGGTDQGAWRTGMAALAKARGEEGR